MRTQTEKHDYTVVVELVYPNEVLLVEARPIKSLQPGNVLR
jgi:hypothetical protein